MTSRPLVSVMMRAFNNEKFICQAVDSVLRQKTNFDFEIIIGDDCSTDGTVKIAQQYKEKYPEIVKVIVNKKNLRVAKNTIEILRRCKGKYIAICDCDDYWCDNNKLQKQIDFLESHPSIVISYHDVKTVSENGDEILHSILPDERKSDFSSSDLLMGVWILTNAMCFRNIANDELINNMSNKVYNEDTFIISILGNYGSGAYLKNIIPSAYRQWSSGVWSLQSEMRRTLMIVSTTAELMLYYRRKKNNEMFCYFKQKMLSKLADIEGKELGKNITFFVLLLKRYWRFIGLKNVFHYCRIL